MSKVIESMRRTWWLVPGGVIAVMALSLGGSASPADAVPLKDVIFDPEDVSLPSLEDLTFDAVVAEIDDYVNNNAPAIKLKVPKFIDLGVLMVDEAQTEIATVTNTISITGPVTLAGEEVEMGFVLDWDDDDSFPSDGHPTITVTADYSVDLGVSVELTIGEAIGIINDFTGFEFDATDQSPDTGLTEAGFTFVYDSETQAGSLDLQGGFRIDADPDDLVVEVLLSMTDPAGSGAGKEPSLFTGLKLTDDELFDETITLRQVFRGVPGVAAFAGQIELPEVTMSMVTPETAVVKKSCGADTACTPLRQRQLDFFGSLASDLPGDFAPGNTLTLAAALRLDSLGADVRQAFGYGEGESLLLTGQVGFDITDLTEGTLNLVDVTLLADLPDLDPGDQALLPDWVRLSDASLKIEYDDDNEIVTAEIAATAAVSVPSQGINLSVDIDAQLSVEDDVATIAILAEPSASNGGWDNVFGIDWLDVTSLGFEVRIIAPEGGEVDVSGAITSSFEIGGEPFSVRVAVELTPEVSAVVTVSFDGQVSIYEVLAQVGIDTSVLPTDLDLTLGPVSVTARVGSGPLRLSVGAEGSFPFLGPGAAQYLFSIRGDDVVFGVRSSAATLDFVTDLMGGQNPFQLTDIPTLGIVGTNAAAGFEDNSFNLSPEEDEFFRVFNGCIGDPRPADCAPYTVDIDQGIHVLVSFPLPSALDGLRDVLPMLWIDPSSGLLLDLSAPFPGAGDGLSFTPLKIRAILPAIVPPVPETEEEVEEEGAYPDWFERARLAFEVTLPSPGGNLSFALVGEMSIRLRDSSVPESTSPTPPASCIRSWVQTVPSFDRYACYDLLDFSVSAGIEISATPKLVLKGALLTEPGVGWPQPFGLDFLRIDAAKIQIGLAPSPTGGISIDLGFLAAGALFDKDFSGSIAMGMIVQSIPAPPFVSVVPTFNGIRFSSQAGIELADFIELYDFAAETAESLGLPAIAPDLSQLPNISLRNLELMVGFASYPDLCIEPGIKLGGTLHINAPPLTVAPPNEAPGGCNPDLPAAADPQACADSPDCFASFALVATVDDGIIVSGTLGDFDIGFVNCDQALLDFRLTPTIQVLKVQGGCEIPGVLAGTIDFYLGLDGVAFRGDVELFPDVGDGVFRAEIEGEAAADLGQVDLSDPATLLALDFDLHAVLSTDFTGLVEESLAPLIENLRLTADVLDDVYDQLHANGGDFLSVILDLPDTIEAAGGDVPQWISDFAGKLNQFRDTLEFYGLDMPNMDKLLGGFDVRIEDGVEGYYEPPSRECQTDIDIPGAPDIPTGIRGTVIDGECWDDPPGGWSDTEEHGTWVDPSCRSTVNLPGIELDGECWAIPPVDVHIPGLHDLSFGAIPATFAELLDDVDDIFEAIIEPLPGIPNNLSLAGLLNTLVDALDNAGSPVDFECVDFRQEAEEGTPDSSLDLRSKAHIFGSDVNLSLHWDFSEPAAGQAAELFGDIVATIFGASDDVECEPLGTTTIAAGSGAPTAAGGDPVRPSLTGFTVSTPATVAEGAELTLTGTFNIEVPSDTNVTISWGDGTPLETITVPAGEDTFTPTHTYVDDDPTGTSSDVRNIVVSAIGKSEHATVHVTNVAPASLLASVSNSNEAGTATLTGTFTDPGVLDTHTVRVTWGDGSAPQTVSLGLDHSFNLTHSYADDSPTGTPSDTYNVSVRISDDDGGQVNATTSATVANVAPSGVTLTPRAASVTEGSFIIYDLAFADPGRRDTHTVTINWGDGTPVQSLQLGAGIGTDTPLPVGHRYVDDNPTNTPSDNFPIVITVRDDDTGSSGAVTRNQTVLDVAPTVLLQVVTPSVNEGNTVSVVGSISDPGVLDTFTLTVDWGASALTDTVLSLPAGAYDFSATLIYGDDGAFTLTATIVDDDTLSDSDSAQLVVNNVNPSTAIDETLTISPPAPSQIPTFIVRSGTPLSLSASASDPGSDDLRFAWDFDSRTSGQLDSGTAVTTSLVNPPATDPDPSPTVQPRVGVGSTVSHTWTQACLYQVGLTVSDDDAGAATDATWVVVTGTERTVRNSGWWYNAYGDNRKPVFSATTLECYRQVVNHLSSVFGPSGSGDYRSIDSIAALRDALNTKQTSDANELLIRPLATTWLNLANGAFTWNQLVDTDNKPGADTPLSQVLRTAEAVRSNPASTREQLLAQQAILDKIQP